MMVTNQQLRVSIIMPVYNREETVEKAIQSVLNQTYSDFEFIIVDDASTDRTALLVQSIQDERIRYIRIEQRNGAPSARNLGIKLANGEWIAFQDSDDIWEPQKLEKQVNSLKEYHGHISPILYTSFYRYRNNNREYIPERDQRKKQGQIHDELLLGNFISTQTVLLSKESLLQVGGFSEDMPRFQDWELWIRLSIDHPFIWIDEPLVHVYYTDSSISSSQAKLTQAYEKILTRHEDKFQQASSKHLASLLFSYGHNLCLAGDIRKGRRMLLRSLRSQPNLFKSIIALLCSMMGTKGYRYFYSRFKNG